MYPNELFNILGVSIDLYTICFMVGIIACFIYTIIAMKKSGYSSTASDTVILIGLLAIIIGLLTAVLFQNLYDYIEYAQTPHDDPYKFTGKMTFIGGLIGGVASFVGIYFLYVYAINPHLKKGNFFKSNMNKGLWYLIRIAPISITIAHGFGRLGCMFAGCCHGKVTTEWYGIWNAHLQAKTVPVQLFEAIFLFVLSAVMIVLLFKFKVKDTMAIYLVSYGVWRFIIEFFRTDERGGLIPGLTPSQFWSIVMVLAGIAVFFIYRYFDKKIEEKEQAKLEEENKSEPLKE